MIGQSAGENPTTGCREIKELYSGVFVPESHRRSCCRSDPGNVDKTIAVTVQKAGIQIALNKKVSVPWMTYFSCLKPSPTEKRLLIIAVAESQYNPVGIR